MIRLVPLFLPLLVLAIPGAVTAQPPPSADPAAGAPPGPEGSTAPPPGGFDARSRIDNQGLHAMTGREDLNLVVNAQNTAQVSGNAVNGTSVTGGVSFASSAFQNLNGLSVISANTGNNVAINSSLNVNVAVRP